MTNFNGQRVTQRGGTGAGRGDDPHNVTGPVIGTNGQAAEGSWSDPAWQQSVHNTAVNPNNGLMAGQTPQQTAQNMYDQHTIAHADGFIGPRIGETYQNSMGHGTAPTMQGGSQPSPANSYIYNNGKGSAGTADRQAYLDNNLGYAQPRTLQHKATGNFVETWKDHTGEQQLNTYGTSANGRSMEPRKDENMNPGGRYGAGIDHNSDDYTDVTDTVKSTQTYKNGFRPRK